MTSPQTTMQTYAMIDDVPYALAQGQDLDELKRGVETAIRTGGAFVEFTVEGSREISALISAGSRVVISVATVEFYERETGHQDFGYDDTYDF